MVEDIHHALRRGIPVESHVNGLQGTTMPALLEYGCLRYFFPSVPKLPALVVSSELGNAICKIASVLGLRENGENEQPLERLDVHPCEFFSLTNKEQILSGIWRNFLGRFTRSAWEVGFNKTEGHLLASALGEMADNTVQHSDAPVPALVGYRVFDGVAQFSVVDVGIGIFRSLTGCRDYHHIRYHNEAIRNALHEGVTRKGQGNGGSGFRSVFKSLAEYRGHLRFRSGDGCIVMDGRGLDADAGRESFPPSLGGFQVTVSCRTANSGIAQPEL